MRSSEDTLMPPSDLRGVIQMRHGPEDDPVRGLAGLDDLGRDGGAPGLEARESDVVLLEGEAEPEAIAGELQHLDGGGGDLGPDTVTGQHGDAHGFAPGN
jgi:hypothetical protein